MPERESHIGEQASPVAGPAAGGAPGFRLTGGRWALVVAGLALLTFLPYALALRAPIWIDEGVFGYMAWAAHETGEPLYRAGYDHKTPGIFLVYRAVQAFDQPGVTRARFVQGAMVLGTALLLFWWLGRAASPMAGVLAACNCVLLLSFKPDTRALTEAPLVLGTTGGFLCLYLAMRRGTWWLWALAGVCLGLAFQFKQVAGLELALAAFLALAVAAPGAGGVGERLRQAALVLAGFAAVFGLTLGYVALTGHASEFWQSAMVPLFDGSTTYGAEERWDSLRVALRHFFPNKALLLVFLLAALALAWRATSRPLRVILFPWLAVAVGGYVLTGSLFDHQAAQFFPPLAALAALAVAGLWRRLSVWPRKLQAPAVALLVLAAYAPLVFAYQQGATRPARELAGRAESPDARTGGLLGESLPPEADLYVIGTGVPVYLYAQRLAPTRLFHTLLLNPRTAAEILDELKRTRPAAVVFTPTFRGLEHELAARVRSELLPGDYVGAPGLAAPEHEVYVRRDLVETSEAGAPEDREAGHG